MRRTLACAISLVLATAALPAIAAPTRAGTVAPAVADATTQLPRGVRPLHYDIEVVPHADSLSFDGQVSIRLEVLKPTDRITFNALDLRFASASLASPDGRAATGNVAVDAAAQTATVRFDETLSPGEYTLALSYEGKIGTQANGLFAIDYETPGGARRALFTQFENSDARRFVPSWDEPNHKATFGLTAVVPADQMAVSNMPVVEDEALGDGTRRVRFDTSPKMSTYLLFFSLGQFDRATLDADGVEIGVVTQAGKADQARFALESSADVLREYNEYFGVPYPLPKLDNVASPGRSRFFSAMENWGAIFTFEYALLEDPMIATQDTRQGIFTTAAHEIAHQWFGDLVTMSWWDDLWLNEGFASWMEGRTTEKLHPEWNTALSAVEVRERAMTRDAVATTHPVVQHVETVEQASQAFDAITYSKGEAVIRMLEAYVGSDAWREGVRAYIRTHAYGNTVSDDLWRAIEASAGKPVTRIAHDFTLQPGVPLLRVESIQCRDGGSTVELRQAEFTRDRPDKTPLSWQVPVIARIVGHPDVRGLVVDGEATLRLPGCGPLVLNAGQSGYYRSLLGADGFAALAGAFDTLEPIDQLGVMNDTWALGMADLQPASNYLDLVAALPADADPTLWRDVTGNLDALDDYYRGDEAAQARFRAFARATLAPVFERVGWEAAEGEAAPVTLLRTALIGALGRLDDPAILAEVRRRYRASRTDPGALPAELRLTVLGLVARNADAATWDALHAQARAETSALVRDQDYLLLARARDEALARRAIAMAMTDEPGATNSATMLSIAAAEHPDLVFDHAVTHLDTVDAFVDSSARARFYPSLGMASRDPAMIGKLEAFARAHIAEGSRRATETAIVGIRQRQEVIDKRLPDISDWLQRHAH